MLTIFVIRAQVTDILSSLKLVFLSLKQARQAARLEGEVIYKVTIEEVITRKRKP